MFSSMTGYVRGGLVEPGAVADLLATAEQSIPVAKRLGIGRLNLHGTGLDDQGLPVVPVEEVTGAMWLAARDTLARVAGLGERHGVQFVLENLNLAVDHPGVPFARAEDCLALVAAVDSPHLRMMLDLYHAQIGEGNLIELCRRALPYIGEIQVADVPGRCEPGTGEIAYPAIARALAAHGLHRHDRDGGLRQRRPDGRGPRLPGGVHRRRLSARPSGLAERSSMCEHCWTVPADIGVLSWPFSTASRPPPSPGGSVRSRAGATCCPPTGSSPR